MYRAGHFGVALIVYAPVGTALLFAGRADLAILGEVAMLALAMVPDYDLRVPFVKHRGITHTVWFALLVGVVGGGAGWLLGGRPEVPTSNELVVFGFAIGTLAVGAHLLADALTPMGITPFWPLSSRNYTLAVARASNTVANYGLLGIGALVTALVLAVAGQPP